MKKIVSIVLLAFICICGYAQTIDPALLEEMGQHRDNEKIRVFVIMRQQYDQQQLNNRAAHFSTRAARREFVVNELKQFAETSQYDLRHSLAEMQRNGLVTEPKVLWIANAISFEATRGAVLSLANRSDIMVIGFDKERYCIPDGEESQPAYPTREITSNVTQVNADQVWNLGYTGQGVVVALIDTGVNYNHLDLADHLWDGGTEFPNHGYDVYNENNDPMDEHGHGTHCAGILCGDGTAGSQTGVAPDATLMCVKISDSSGYTSHTVEINAMQWAIAHGCDIISMSYGGNRRTSAEQTLIRDACVNVLNAGVIASFSAGNEGDNLDEYPIPNNISLPSGCPPPYLDPDQQQNPGGLSCSVCVGAVDSNDQAAYFTSQGPFTWSDSDYADYPYTPGSQTEFGLIRPDVCAPGVSIKSADFNSNNGYSIKSGTSMAAPCVAGCMALMLSKYPDATPADLCRILEETAVPLSTGKSNIYGCGRVDALAAVMTFNFDFSAVCSTGQRLYYNIIDATNHYVEITYPGNSPWGGYTKPTGNITLPSTVTFNGVTYTVTKIGDNAFENCDDLTGSLTIPNSVTTIAFGAFYGCSGFNGQLTIPNSVTSIGTGAFNNCSGFNGQLTIPNSVTSIGSGAFNYCSGFNGQLTIGRAVTLIGNDCFCGLAQLSSLMVLPDTPPTLGQNAFYNVPTTIPVYVPPGSLTDYQTAYGWSNFTNIQCREILNYSINDDGVSLTVTSHVDGTSATGQLFIPQSKTINGTTYTVTKIGSNAFANCSGLTGSPIIPNTVTEIGAYAFWNCHGLSGNLTLPNSLTAIGDFAFANCWGLTGSLSIPNSVTSIGQSAFYGCSHFTGSLNIPNSVTSIGVYAFKGCSSFTGSLTIGNSVTSIGAGAFQNCTFNGLSINMPNIPDNFISTVKGSYSGPLFIGSSVNSIGINAFQNCTFNGLFINMPNIPQLCAYNMGGQYNGSLIIASSVTSIGDYAFYQCSGFTGTLTIDNSVTSIGTSAFQGCGFTGPLTIPNSVTTISVAAFYGCSGFTGNLTIPSSVTTIGSGAFRDCSGFSGSLTLPNSVTSIGEETFQGCSGLNGTLTLGLGVNSIGENAFKDCTGFTSIRALPEYPPTTSSTAFTNVPKNILVEVPCHTLSQYQAAQGWSEFTNMQGVLCGGVVVPSAFPSEGGTVTGNGYYTYGQTCTVTATPNAGYIFLHWSIDGEVVSCSPTYSWTMEGETVQIKAVFMLITGTLVGEATSSNVFLPSYSYYKYSLTQQIYTQAEIGGSTTINSLSFFNEGPTKTRSYDIYMVHTSKSSFSSGTDWISVTTANRVFSGTVTMTRGYWTTIELATPFAYNGSSNLAIIVDDNTGDYTPSPYMACRTYSTSNYQAIRIYSDGTNYNPSSPSSYGGTRLFEKNQILLNSHSYDVTATVAGNGTGTVSGAGHYGAGMTCTLRATPDEGNLFLHWSLNGTVASCETTYSFVVTENAELEAVFMPLTGVYVSNNWTANSTYLPSYSYFRYGLSEQIYTPNELGGSTTINSISFYNAGNTKTRSYDIYMMHTAKNSFSSGTDWVSVSSANRVFSGTVTMTKGYWTTIELDTPFAYNGTSNLLLVMDDNTGSWSNEPHMECRGYIPDEQQSIYIYNDNTNFNPSSPSGYVGTLFTIPFKNQLILNGSGTCARTIPYAYGFEDSDEFNCWSMVDCDGFTGINVNGAYSGSYGFSFKYNYAPPQYLISPELVGTDEGLAVEFQYKNNSLAYCERFQVGWSTTDADVDSFTWEEETTVSNTRWKRYHTLLPAGTKFVAVRCNSYDQFYLYLDDFSFTAPEPCMRPGALAASDVALNSATLSWNGLQDAYTLRYRQASVFYDDFEDGLDQWTTIDADGDGYSWQVNTTWGGHESQSMVLSASWVSGVGPLTPDNYLVTPRIPLGGIVRFYACAQDNLYAAEHFGVAVSTTNNTSPSAFTMVQEWTMAAKGSSGRAIATRGDSRDQGTWYEFTVDLGAYAGMQGYVAIRHFDCTDKYYLDVDDFGVYSPNALTDWTTVLVAGSSVDINGLMPATEYEWQVRGMDCDGSGTYTDWSAMHYFTTDTPPIFISNGNWNEGRHWSTGTVPPAGSDVIIQANVTVPVGYLAVANAVSIQGGSITVADGGQLKHNTQGLEVTMKKNIVGYDDADDIRNYYLLSFPFVHIDVPAAMSATGSDFYRFDPSEPNAEWRNLRSEPFYINKVHGYLFASPESYELSLTCNTYSSNTETSWDHVVEYTEGSANPYNGWELLGNPFTYNAYVYRQTSDGELVPMEVMIYNADGDMQTIFGGPVAPMQGFFVHVTEETTVCFRGEAHINDYVDLGLPSGLLWATCNVGADSPEDYGDYFAWGETQPKDTYNWSTYQYCNGSYNTLTKYCNNSSYGYNGFTDNLTTLLPEDDAATANWGSGWRMPTEEEWQELYNSTTHIWTTQNGVSGQLFTAANGNSLFLPAAGYRGGSSLYYAGSYGYYWSSSLYTDGPYYAWYFTFNSGYPYMGYDIRGYGRSVRPVRSASQN